MVLSQRQASHDGRPLMHHDKLERRGAGSQRLPGMAICGGLGLGAGRLQLCNSDIAVTGPVGNHLQEDQEPAVGLQGPSRPQLLPDAAVQEALRPQQVPCPSTVLDPTNQRQNAVSTGNL